MPASPVTGPELERILGSDPLRFASLRNSGARYGMTAMPDDDGSIIARGTSDDPWTYLLPVRGRRDPGILGFLHVLEPYRRLGYAASLSCWYVAAVLERRGIPFVHIEHENRMSLALAVKTGVRDAGEVWWAKAREKPDSLAQGTWRPEGGGPTTEGRPGSLTAAAAPPAIPGRNP